MNSCAPLAWIATLLVASTTYAAEKPAAADNGPVDADLLLAGGLILDGAGNEGAVGDVAIVGEKIVAVGKFKRGKIKQTIDCRELVIAPGFIDLHSHSDRSILKPATRANTNFLTQGCTTVVTGNCGLGPWDAGDYLNKVDQLGAGTNVIHLLPHGGLRIEVMGRVNRAPTSEELERMKQLADKAMQDGAWGMATGLIYVPAAYAKTEELVELARVVAKQGGFYASHIRGEGQELLDALEEALEIGRQAGLPVHISHFKASGSDVWGKLRIAGEVIEKARRSGQRVTADQYPYTASSTSLEATLIPTWASEGGLDKLRERLASTDDQQKIRQIIARRLETKPRLQIVSYGPRPDWVGMSLDEIGTKENRDVIDLVVEMEMRGTPRIVNFGMSEEDVRYAMRLPWVATASDGSAMVPDADRPHPRSFGTFTRKIGRYALAEKVVTLAQAVRSATGLPADILQIEDRGYLRPGTFADVVVFDPKTIMDRATYDSPYQFSDGIRYVLVAGQPAVHEGTPTGVLAGRALRHGKHDKVTR